MQYIHITDLPLTSLQHSHRAVTAGFLFTREEPFLTLTKGSKLLKVSVRSGIKSKSQV